MISIPSGYLMFKDAKIAGEESIIPKKEHTMYTEDDLYAKIRHPQALGEGILALGCAFFFHSSLIFLLSLIWLPIFAYFCFVEEKDLVIRYGQAYKDYQARTGMFIPKRK
jgi:protein-S-isoprenylcysteine O-methyltransferase Ste14